MRRATKTELEELTEIINVYQVAESRAQLNFRLLRQACAAPIGYVLDEVSGEWTAPPTPRPMEAPQPQVAAPPIQLQKYGNGQKAAK